MEMINEQNELSKSPDIEMVYVQGGTFQMGSEIGNSDEMPVHTVMVNGFYMGKYDVTVAQFKQFIDKTGYMTDADKLGGSYFWDKLKSKYELKSEVNWRCDAKGNIRPESEYGHPVIHVSWNDANEFCNWMTEKTGNKYRLPTEAEWEYAAGNGWKHTKYSWGNDGPCGKKGGNIADESAKKEFKHWTIFDGFEDGYIYTAPVGSYSPNDFGLYDMTGNVWEWCNDWYSGDFYKKSSVNNPENTEPQSGRVLRGGSWSSLPFYCRVAGRSNGWPHDRTSFMGFRIIRMV